MSDATFMEDETEDNLSRMIANAMQIVLGMHPHPFQLDVLCYVLKTKSTHSTNTNDKGPNPYCQVPASSLFMTNSTVRTNVDSLLGVPQFALIKP